MARVEVALRGTTYSGEAPHWDGNRQKLYFVDIFRREVYSYDPRNKDVAMTCVGENSVSFAIPVQGKADQLLISRGKQLCVMDWSGLHHEKPSQVKHIYTADKDYPNNRFNDGKCDPTGRLWAGTMSTNESLYEMACDGSLYTLDLNLAIKKHVCGLQMSNGLTWHGNTMYFTDSLTRRIDAFDWNSEEGNIVQRREAFALDEFNLPGVPDGMTADCHGRLWVAYFGAGKVLCLDPVVGKMIGSIDMPCTNVTSVTFGGPSLDIMYVTSATHGLSLEEVGNQPYAGSVFQVTGLGTRGCSPGVPFAGKLSRWKAEVTVPSPDTDNEVQ